MNKKAKVLDKIKLISMSKFLVIILLVSVVFHLNYGREFDIKGAEKLSEDDVLRGAHFKVHGFQVNILKYNS